MTSAIFAQGVAALRAGDHAAAERILLSIVERDVRAHAAWQALSMCAVRAGLADIAVARAQRAVELDRKNAGYLNSLGIAHSANGEAAAAEQAFRRAVKLKPAYAEAHYNLAKVLRQAGRLGEALAEYERAHALEPGAVPAQLGLAAAYRQNGQPERALSVLRRAASHGVPDDDIIPYLAECLADVEGPDAAVSSLRAMLERQPDNRQAHHILGLLLLSVGNLREGWPHFLWRAHLNPQRMRERPAALPERLDGRRVFLRAEEGIGDILFYLRFAGELARRGATYALECPVAFSKLAPLIEGRVAMGAPEATDIAIWIADLPALLAVQSAFAPFALRVEAERSARARERLAQLGPPPYLALTWRAGTDPRRASELGAHDAGLRLVYKEIALQVLGDALRGWRGTLVSLQRGLRPGELEVLGAAAGTAVHDLAETTEDLRDTLAFLENFEEHVAVLNTNVHLLAGIGRTARVLLPRPMDWRWTRGPGESPWFAGFAVYREPASFDWTEPMARLRRDLFAR